MPYPLPLTRTEAYLAYKAGVIQQSDLKPSLAVPRNGIDAWLAYWTGLAADYPKREDGTPHILQEEEAYIAYLCGVINEYPEKCLRRVGAYLRYLISARWGRPDHPLNREELYLSLIKTQFIPSGDPSSDIKIDGTAKAPFVDVKMYGDTYQQTYTGKNLLAYPYRNTTKTVDGITFTDNGDGSVTVNGTLTGGNEAIFWITREIWSYNTANIVVPAGTYTISPTGNANVLVYVSAYGEGETQRLLWNGNASTSPATFTLEEKASLTVRVSVKPQGTSINNLVIKPQLESGSTVTTWEKFVGGVPSPNPDYPQQIQTVTGRQVVKVEGKNLNRFPYASGSSRTHRGLTFTANSDGSVTIKGTHDGSGTAIYYLRDFWAYNETNGVVVDANTTITASITGGAEYGIRFIAEGYRSDATYDQFNTTSTQTITTAAKATFNGRITVYAGFSSEEGVTVYPMLEKSSTATAYEPYSSNNYEINLGKNLYNPATATATGYFGQNIRNELQICSDEIYTFNITDSRSYATVRLYDSSGTQTRTLGNAQTAHTITFTAASNEVKAVLEFYARNNVDVSTYDFTGVQFEKGSEATSYAPYFTPIELCRIAYSSNIFQDYIYKDGDDWKIHKATTTKRFSGADSEGWVINNSGTGNFYYRCPHAATGSYGTPDNSRYLYCNYESGAQITSSNTAQGVFVLLGGDVRLRCGTEISLDDWKAKLATTNMVLTYALATATDTTITDQTLISQLEALVAGGAENGTTYIKVNAVSPNLPGLLVVEAPKYE